MPMLVIAATALPARLGAAFIIREAAGVSSSPRGEVCTTSFGLRPRRERAAHAAVP